jgi:hypothetical protein
MFWEEMTDCVIFHKNLLSNKKNRKRTSVYKVIPNKVNNAILFGRL